MVKQCDDAKSAMRDVHVQVDLMGLRQPSKSRPDPASAGLSGMPAQMAVRGLVPH